MTQAVHRLDGLGIVLTHHEKAAIEKARTWRDRMIHHEFVVNVRETKAVYSRLFEFATAFHAEHLGGELHANVQEAHWSRRRN